VRQVVLVALALCCAEAALAQGIDTRVTFTFADDDVLHGPDTPSGSTPSPTLPSFTPTSANRLFYDDYERRDNGLENLSHLVLFGHKPGFFAGLDTEAALVLRAEFLASIDMTLRDDGSYVRLIEHLGADTLSLTAFPLNARRFALGYSYNLIWGGDGIFKSATSPGIKVEWDTDGAYAFVGAKTGQAEQRHADGTLELDTVWGALGGAGVDVTETLRIEGGAGFFRRGIIDRPELEVPNGQGRLTLAPWQAFGGSAQVTYHVGAPIGVPIDFELYRNDPLEREVFFKLEEYPGGVSLMVQSELNWVAQTLQDFDRAASSVIQQGRSADLVVKVKVDRARFFALGVYRDLAYVTLNIPSYPPFVSFPRGIKAMPEAFVSLGADYALEGWHVTPGFSLGAKMPAYLTSRLNAGSTPADGAQTMVFRSVSDIALLNPGDKVALILAGKVTLRWDLSEMLAFAGELQASYDRNRRVLAQDPTGVSTRQRTDPKIFGFCTLLQARL